MGEWTPVFGGSISTAGQVYGSQHGEFSKNGRTVFVSATVTLIKKGDIVGHLEIQGLPYRSAPTHDSSCVFGDFDDTATPQVWVGGIINSGVTVVWLRHRDNASTSMSLMDTHDITDITAFQMQCTYLTDQP